MPPVTSSLLPSRLVQIAYRVNDLESGCQAWADAVGAGPFLVREHLQVSAMHRGEPAIYDHSAAFGQWGNLMLELIVVHQSAPPALAEIVLHDNGNLGVINHLACFVDDVEIASAHLQSQGMPLAMTLTTSSGMNVHFLDARQQVGALLELYAANEHLLAHYQRVADLAKGWDGTNLMRPM